MVLGLDEVGLEVVLGEVGWEVRLELEEVGWEVSLE